MKRIQTATVAMLSIFVISTIPIVFAGVQPWVWSFYCLLMIAIFILQMFSNQDQPLMSSVRSLKLMIALFFIWTFFLCMPLPYPVLSLLSPTRSEILSKALALNIDTSAYNAAAYMPRTAFSWWAFLLSLGLFCVVVCHVCRERKMLKRVVFVIIGIGLMEAIYGLMQALVPSMGVLWVDYIHDYLGTARGTFINRNSFAAFIEMIWPLALGLTLAMNGRVASLKEALGSDKLNRQALMALAIIVFLLALFLTRSRAGIISGLIGFLTFSIMARSGIKTMALHTRVLMGGTIFLLCIYTMTIGAGPIVQRFLSLGADSGSRMDIWRDSLPIVKDHPLGVGLGNYENVFQVYNQSLITEKTVVHAHNDYLQLLVETGWIGFLALLGAFFIFIGRSVRRIKQLDYRRDPLRYFLAVGAFSGLISVSVHSFFDFNLQIPANLLYFIVLIAVLSACTRPQKTINLQPQTNNI